VLLAPVDRAAPGHLAPARALVIDPSTDRSSRSRPIIWPECWRSTPRAFQRRPIADLHPPHPTSAERTRRAVDAVLAPKHDAGPASPPEGRKIGPASFDGL